ncbi:MAG: substrate-binding domain-containing protein [Acidimicrobiales bacterium]
MKLRRTRIRRIKWLATFIAVNAVGLFAALAPATQAAASPALESTGSSFAGVAIEQWIGEASTLYGLSINFQVSSSVVGLDDFAENQIDFGASDIPYSSGQALEEPNQPYQYLPDVAGALAFMYNLQGSQSGTQIKSLVLTTQVIEEIFTGVITTWCAPQIVQIQPPSIQGNMPCTTIIPVYRVDASGENYLLSDYLLHEDNSDFVAYQNAMQASPIDAPSATWPTPPPGTVVPPGYPGWTNNNLQGQSGSDNAANYVAAASSNGAITYVETAYAIQHSDPVASVVNADGNPVQPTSVNDATALEDAVLYADLTQNLASVYTNPLPNAYPLSSYSYLVTPCSPNLVAAGSTTKCSGTGASSPFPAVKGQALGQFVQFLACAGQQQMAVLGYSPLPPNLVQEDFNAIGRMNGGQQPPQVSSADCKNPYVDGQTVLPGEPSIIGGNPPTTNQTVPSGGGGEGKSGSHTSTTTSGSNPGSTGTNGPGGSTGTTTPGDTNPSTGGKGSTTATTSPAAAAAQKYLKHLKKVEKTSGPSIYARSADFRAGAATALGFSSPAVQIACWCIVFLAAVFLPVFILGRRRRRPSTKAAG